MIKSFRHARLEAFYHKGVTRGLPPEHLRKLRRILTALDQSENTQQVALHGVEPHALKGPFSGTYAVKVSRNWRVTFRFEDGHVYDVDYVDYH